MIITVFGASGETGGHVVALADQRGHHVRAVYRTPPDTPPALREAGVNVTVLVPVLVSTPVVARIGLDKIGLPAEPISAEQSVDEALTPLPPYGRRPLFVRGPRNTAPYSATR